MAGFVAKAEGAVPVSAMGRLLVEFELALARSFAGSEFITAEGDAIPTGDSTDLEGEKGVREAEEGEAPSAATAATVATALPRCPRNILARKERCLLLEASPTAVALEPGLSVSPEPELEKLCI